jgi:hypothetical protein
MDFFVHQDEKMGKKLRLIFGVFFWCGIMNIHNEKLVHDA